MSGESNNAASGYSFPWERAAMRGDEMPDGISLVDQTAYTALRNIYQAYHKQYITRAAAAAEKRKIRRQYELMKEAEAFQDKLASFRSRQLKAVEAASAACRKEPSKENALRLCDVLDGLQRP